MHLEELRRILLSERESGQLVQMPHDTYLTAQAEIRAIQKEVYATEDPFSDESRMLIEKVASIRATSEEIFSIRIGKIVAIAQSAATGGFIGKNEIRLFLPPELEVYHRISDAIRDARRGMLEGKIPVAPESAGLLGMSASELDKKSDYGITDPHLKSEPENERYLLNAVYPEDLPSSEESDGSDEYALVRVITDMEPFMGLDGHVYEIFKDDIITLPIRNAEVLSEREIVLNINSG